MLVVILSKAHVHGVLYGQEDGFVLGRRNAGERKKGEQSVISDTRFHESP